MTVTVVPLTATLAKTPSPDPVIPGRGVGPPPAIDKARGLLPMPSSASASDTPVIVRVRPVKTCPVSLVFAVTVENRSAPTGEPWLKVGVPPVAVRLGRVSGGAPTLMVAAMPVRLAVLLLAPSSVTLVRVTTRWPLDGVPAMLL
ncbi:hypothetical protein [Azospirillum brasilense]|uniref:hypothetical protein n=1 Tax=Azospirillum brasilense TaxID=192 RepID=UPI001659AB40|nr:hypothetical protein [Azospirillum brasilense]